MPIYLPECDVKMLILRFFKISFLLFLDAMIESILYLSCQKGAVSSMLYAYIVFRCSHQLPEKPAELHSYIEETIRL